MSLLHYLPDLTTQPTALIIALSSIGAVTAAVVTVRRLQSVKADAMRRKFSAGTLAAATAFLICTSVSLNTSFRFTLDGLQMTGTFERAMSCAAFESLLAMCVLGARERMAGPDKSPGWYGGAVWIFAGLSAIPAWHEGGGLSTATAVRIIIGSFGSALAAHSALGLELKHRSGDESQAPLAQITRDLRERLMARLGLSVRNRTAQQIAQERALTKAVDLADKYDRLTEKDRMGRRGTRLARSLAKRQDRAGIATNEAQRDAYRARVAHRRFATALDITPEESPWHTSGTADSITQAQAENEHLRSELAAAQSEASRLRGEQTRHMEELAASVEAALSAHGGALVPAPRAEAYDEPDDEPDCVENESDAAVEARRAAAAYGGRPRATARVPRGGTDEDQQHAPDTLDLTVYATKKEAIQALYRDRIAVGDPRTINQITEELRAELAEAGISFDRAPAHRAISEVHPAGQGELLSV